MKVLFISSEWPTEDHPEWVPFLLQEIAALKEFGIEIDIFHFRGNKNPFNYILAWFDLRIKHDLHRYDLVHVQWGQNVILALPKVRPIVTTFRGSDLEGFPNRFGKYTILSKILQKISYFGARFSDEVILVSESLSKFIPRVNFNVLPTCLDTNLFVPKDKLFARKQLNLPNNEFLVLFASNPERTEKRFWLANAAVELLSSEINHQLIVTKDIQHSQMPLYLNACDVLLITSSHEGSPTIVFEALACNLPIVSVNVGDIYKRISAVEGCYICTDDSPRTIADNLYLVFKNNKKVIGRESILMFDKQHFVNRIISIYSHVIRERKFGN